MSNMPTILLVDDEPEVTAALKRAFRRQPWRVLEAHSGKAALDLLEWEPVDVIVSDEQMPGMSGVDFLAQVRRLHPQTIRMVLSGHSSVESAARAINEGEVYRFFIKPCRDEEIILGIREALRIKDLERRCLDLQQTVDRQQFQLRDLERANPGITQVRRTADGSIVIDDEDL